jgi:ribonuclease HII
VAEIDTTIAGVDEAGRGPLAGPVVAAAVILNPVRPIKGLGDSKTLSPAKRERLARMIIDQAVSVGVGIIEPDEIDRINILKATLKAMRLAIGQLEPAPALVRVDGNQPPRIDIPVQTLVGGDALDPAIGAASIIAKTRRDALMIELHERYPDYGFDRHKGYPTRQHLAALERFGPCPVHRRSFHPVRQLGLF